MTLSTVEEPPASCPELAALEASPLAATVREHVTGCPSCKLVLEVFQGDHGDPADCLRFDALLAARGDGTLNSAGKNLLDRHLASCASCRAVAETLSPLQDAHGDLATLPRVDPAGYALGLEVARGGMGRILAARDLRVGRPIAVKELLGRSPHLAARFEREARVTARLQHPGIVPIYEIGRWPDGTPFYTMRMVDGRTLREAIERTTTLASRLALLPAVIAACEAVAFAHSQRVIHRDLTPSNVLVGAYGETVVIDWGLAKDLSQGTSDDDPYADPYRGTEPSSSTEGLTGAGAIVGTLAYMPPEQANALPVDERADVYALGAILYHLLAGAPAYRSRSAGELLEQVKAAAPTPIDQIAPTSPRDLVSIVTKAMARAPDARYPSARELAEELKRFQTGRMVEAHHYSRAELVKRFFRRNRAAVTVTALAALVLASAGSVGITRILHSSEEARVTARELLLEKGRVELLAGDSLRALAYLFEAYQRGARGPEIDLLLGHAVVDVESSESRLECGDDDRDVEISPDGTSFAGACHDRARIWQTGDTGKVITLGPLGDGGGFDELGYSQDGRLIATWGQEGIARLWETSSGKLVREFVHRASDRREPSAITYTTFTPDDRRIATTGDDGYARIWDVATGRELLTIHGNTDVILPRLFGVLMPDGERLITLTFSGNGAAYRIDTGAEVGRFSHGGLVAGGEISADGKLAVSCGLDGVTKVLDTDGGALKYMFAGHADVVWKCVFSADGTRVLTASHDGTAKVWNVSNGTLVTTVRHGDLVWIGRFSMDGRHFVTISPGKNMKVWDSTSGALLATYGSRGKDARFLPDGRLAALRGDGRIQVWPKLSSESFSPPHGTRLVGTTADGSCLATDDDQSLKLWATTGARLVSHLQLLPPISTGTQALAARTPSGVVVVAAGGATVTSFDLAASPSRLHLAADGRRLAVMWSDRAPEVWDVAGKRKLVTLDGANRALLSDDGRRAVAWLESNDRPATMPVIWDVDASTPALQLVGALDATPIGFALDNKRVVLAEMPGTPTAAASVWSTASGARILLQPRTDVVPTIDPTGRWLTTVGNDREVTVWDLEDGAARSSFTGELLQHAQVNGDGNLIVAVGDHGRNVMILNARDGRILTRRAIEHFATIVTADGFRAPSSVAWWTPDSTRIASRSEGFAMWRATNPNPPSRISQIVRKYVPWRIVNGHLELIRNARLAGLVTHGGRPIANAAIEVLIRRPADIGTAPINWVTMKARLTRLETHTDADGSFVFEGLVPGEYEYRLTVTAEGRTLHREVQHLGPDEEPLQLELDAR